MDDLGKNIFRPPPPDYFCEHPHHRWEAEKFEMDLDDIFTTLPRQFNMMVIPVLDRDAFRLEASHVASITNDRKDFFDLLKVRLEARREELIGMMGRTFEDLACDPNQMEDTTHWADAMRIYHSKSLDAFVRFFAGLLRSSRTLADTAVSAGTRHVDLTLQPEVSSTRESETSADTATIHRKRKRSSPSSLGAGEEQDGEDAKRPAQKARLDVGASEPRRPPSSTSPRKPSSQHFSRARQGQLPLPPPPSPSEVLSTTTVTPTASLAPPRPQHAARGASSQDSSGQRDNATSSHAASAGNGGQLGESCLTAPDTKERDMEAGYTFVHNASSTNTRQGGGPQSPLAKRPQAHAHTRSASQRAFLQSNAKKPASRRIPGPTGRTRQGPPGGMDQTRHLRRLSRRTHPRGQALYELDHKNRARPVVAETPRRKVRGARPLGTRQG